jgi:hypothetical protein
VYGVNRLSQEEWKDVSEKVHLVTFGEDRGGIDRVDYALLCTWNETVGGFFTIKEMDADTVYIQHGGAFPNFAKSIYVVGGFAAVLAKLKEQYKHIKMKVLNTNYPMIKLALSQNFLIIGCALVKDKLYLEMNLEV